MGYRASFLNRQQQHQIGRFVFFVYRFYVCECLLPCMKACGVCSTLKGQKDLDPLELA